MNAKRLDFSTAFAVGDLHFAIRAATPADLETLRVWKNDHRQFFHHKDLISPEQQTAWFARFAQDPSQQMFICEAAVGPIACVGYREKSANRVELFNLICGRPEFAGRGYMALFYQATVQELRRKGIDEIELEVLASNERAVRWYLDRGFRRVAEEPGFYKLVHKAN